MTQVPLVRARGTVGRMPLGSVALARGVDWGLGREGHVEVSAQALPGSLEAFAGRVEDRSRDSAHWTGVGKR